MPGKIPTNGMKMGQKMKSGRSAGKDWPSTSAPDSGAPAKSAAQGGAPASWPSKSKPDSGNPTGASKW